MLTGVHIAFIGGDARQLEVIQACTELDATITLIGFENLQSEFPGAHKQPFLPETLNSVDAVVLPIVSCDEQGRVESIFTHRTLVITDAHMQALSKKAKIYTGIAKPYLRQLCEKYSVPLEELLNRDEVAIYNSIPTAEGALMMAMQNTDFTIHGAKTAVLGFGRTGMTLARVLKGIGAAVRVGVHRPDHFARAFEQGLDPFYTEHLKELAPGFELVFNTVPQLILTPSVLANFPSGAVIIDLASAPGGTDFRFAEKRGLKALLAPSLPGIVAPKTAGRIIARTLIRLVVEQTGKQED
ncbi:MAG: dipicolinic acid synthetase subunit A [Bacillus thermozeamaize]|jgi:dipicolinate synthase subunit A|uniref:Dipicolinic acid synthetase subunit A n=1 Tax=Bacillus thermozeamaize TaxID=230954 RepID=A0A1Y3PMY0_9BACI|nr:MAG: dipicolinic acid synthetase subunit A [Bacillus thermozeamaize]